MQAQLFNNSKQETFIPEKVYICVDVDSFFAQCDSRKLGLDNSVPLVSVQWGQCVSVNYAARARGVKNWSTLPEALKAYPDVVVSHADTFKPGESISNPYNTDLGEKFKKHDRRTEKVSLEHYRAEAERIFSILEKYSDIVEKASFDEAFLDVTGSVIERYENRGGRWYGKMLGGCEFKPQSKHEILLQIGSEIAQEIRTELVNTLDYTCSAGISYNKMLCKLASSLNKPDGQAIICPRYVLEALKPVAIKKIRNFGRKIAEAFEEVGFQTLGQLRELNLQQTYQVIKDEKTAKWIYFRARGYDEEEVKEKEFASKSIMSSKLVRDVTTMKDLEVVINLVLTDLYTRLVKYYEKYKTVPRSLHLHYANKKWENAKIKSVGIDLKVNPDEFKSKIEEKAMSLISSVKELVFPCYSLAFSLRDFEKNDFDKFEFDLVSLR